MQQLVYFGKMAVMAVTFLFFRDYKLARPAPRSHIRKSLYNQLIDNKLITKIVYFFLLKNKYQLYLR